MLLFSAIVHASGYVLLASLLAAAVFSVTFRIARQQYEKTLVQELQKLCLAVLVPAQGLIEQRRTAELEAMLKKLGATMDTRLTVVAPDGAVLARYGLLAGAPYLLSPRSLRPNFGARNS